MGCAKTTLYLSNGIGIILSAGLLIGSLYLFLGPLPEEAVGYVALVPDGAFYGFFAISGVILLLALIGCLGAMQQNKFLLSLYAVIVFILLIAEAAVAAILLTNYFAYSESLDTPGVGEILEFTRTIENEAVSFAMKNPSSWFTVQTVLGCCGYNFRTTYNKAISKAENVERFTNFVNTLDQVTDKPGFLAIRDPLNSGLNCTAEGQQEIADIRLNDTADATGPTPEQQLEADESDIIGLDEKYFCEEGFFSMARPYYTAIGATGAAIAVILFLCVVSAFNLLCCVSEDDGGFKNV